MATKTLRVDYLTRVEGEGALDLEISDGRVTSAQLRIFEPPRFFEAFLRGRGYAETPDMPSRTRLASRSTDRCVPCGG
jgi:coenzyme F420-reducing hydrogenase alpha subunit